MEKTTKTKLVHTPGPWLMWRGDEVKVKAPWAITSRRRDGQLVAETFGGPTAELEANARLISSAPDYADASEAVLLAWDGEGDMGPAIAALRKVHARAQGSR